jgi:hypothetical protein
MGIVTGIVAGIGVAAVVQTVLVWRATRAIARLSAIEARVERFGDALTLLTDTTESAFRAVAIQMTHRPAIASAVAPAASAARTRRITRAVTRGATIEQVAAAEEVAEGEVRLRLQMADDKAARRAPKAATVRKKKPAPVKHVAPRREGARGSVRLD